MKLLRHLPRFQQAYRQIEHLAGRESWSRRQIEEWQLERLNAVWRHATRHVPYYRDLARKRNLPLEFRSLEQYRQEVPLLTKATICQQPQRLLSEEPAPGYWKRTGGSTMTPMSCYWEQAAFREMLAAKYRFHAMWGVDIFDRAAFLWGHSASFQPGWAGRLARWRQPWEDRLRNRIRLSAYHLDPPALREHLRRIGAFRPALLYGYSMAMGLLAEEAATIDFRCEALKLFVMTSEAVLPRYVEIAERTLGVPALSEYGAIECGFLAGETPDRTLRVREDVVLLETVPLQSGRHEIVVSVLNNPSFPLLRYAISDAVDVPLEVPAVGFARLQPIAGRSLDLVITRSGGCLHPMRLDALFKYQTKSVRRFRVRQRCDGFLYVEVELDRADARLDAPALEQAISEVVEGFPVSVVVVDSLPNTPAGKHRSVISELAQQRTRHTFAAAGVVPTAPVAEQPAVTTPR